MREGEFRRCCTILRISRKYSARFQISVNFFILHYFALYKLLTPDSPTVHPRELSLAQGWALSEAVLYNNRGGGKMKYERKIRRADLRDGTVGLCC